MAVVRPFHKDDPGPTHPSFVLLRKITNEELKKKRRERTRNLVEDQKETFLFTFVSTHYSVILGGL